MNDHAATQDSKDETDLPRKEAAFLLLAGIFLVSLVVANLITAKLFVLFGVTLAAGIIPYPVTFLATDLICEVYGQKRANLLVFVGFILSLYVLVILKLGQHAEPFEAANVQSEYEVIFGQSARAIFASMVAYLVAQLVDVRIFHFWKRKTKGKHLWLRNNASTMFSQLVDTVLVISILFWGQLPTATLIEIMVASYLFKLSIAAIDTPFFYFGSGWLRRFLKTEAAKSPSRTRTEQIIALACLTNVALLIVGGALVSEQWTAASPGVGWQCIVLAILFHVLNTIMLAREDITNQTARFTALLGLLCCILSYTELSSGSLIVGMVCGISQMIATISAHMVGKQQRGIIE